MEEVLPAGLKVLRQLKREKSLFCKRKKQTKKKVVKATQWQIWAIFYEKEEGNSKGQDDGAKAV